MRCPRTDEKYEAKDRIITACHNLSNIICKEGRLQAAKALLTEAMKWQSDYGFDRQIHLVINQCQNITDQAD